MKETTLEDGLKALLRSVDELKTEMRGSMDSLSGKVDVLSAWQPDLEARFVGLQETVSQLQVQLRAGATLPPGGSIMAPMVGTGGGIPSAVDAPGIRGPGACVGATPGQFSHGKKFTTGGPVLGNSPFPTQPPITGMVNFQTPMHMRMDSYVSSSGVAMSQMVQGVGQASPTSTI